MPPKKPRRKITKKIHQKRRRTRLVRRWILVAVLFFAFVATGIFLKQKIGFYYAMYFNKQPHRTLSNTAVEQSRIDRIIGYHVNNAFGVDISHYQKKEDIRWDSLSIGHGSVPITFVILRATMGNRNADRHFPAFWAESKKHGLLRGAYHFYRADEDPVLQANNFLGNVKLEKGDLPPVLDIEKIPRRKSREALISDLKIWCKIVEEAYGQKPIIYTYYHYYKDFLRDDFQQYPLWLANYNDVPAPSPVDTWVMWQFSENGIVSGADTKLDLNVFNGGKAQLERLALP